MKEEINWKVIPKKVNNSNAKDVYQKIKEVLKEMGAKTLKRRNVYNPSYVNAVDIYKRNQHRWESVTIKKDNQIKKIVGVQLVTRAKVFLGSYPSHKKQFTKWDTREILIKIGEADSPNPVNIRFGDRVAIIEVKGELVILIKQNAEMLDKKFKPHYIHVIRKHQ